MSIEEVQRLALMLSRSMWVRWFANLNYPFEPQLMGLMLADGCNGQVGIVKGGDMLAGELTRLGFAWNDDLRMWTILRAERAASAADSTKYERKDA